jgi:DNA-binding NarL/FixJ family response regulator
MSDILSRAHQRTISTDITSISLRIDELIGRNATNSPTRSSLRDIREELEALQGKIETLSKDSSALTRRESEILGYIQDGESAIAIAKTLSISEPTVKSHMAAIYRKLGAKNKTQAISEAVRRGLLAK